MPEEQQKIKIAIAVTFQDFSPSRFWTSLLAMMFKLESDENIELYWEMNDAKTVDTNRNGIIRMLLEGPADYILWLDSDQIFGDSLFYSLKKEMDESGADIISATTVMKLYPFNIPAFIYPDDTKEKMVKIEEKYGKDFKLNKMFWVDGTGMHATLIKRKVFEALQLPYYKFIYDEQGRVKTGEDIYFCMKAKEKGFKIAVTPKVFVRHSGGIGLGLGDWYYAKHQLEITEKLKNEAKGVEKND